MSGPGDPEYEDKSLRDRLYMHGHVYLARADSRAAAWRLQRRGECSIRNGGDKDQGLLIVSRVRQSARGTPGGAA